MSIVAEHLLKIYGTQKAVNDLSFTVNKGEIVGFLGPNGAGKSTTMKMLTGFLKPDQGRVTICGIDMAKDPIAAKRMIGYLPEANPLYFDLYVREYLQFVAKLFQVSDIRKRMQEVLDLTGLAAEQGKKLGQLSKGYKQRAGLCAALIHDPEVLILDEPTSGLDPNQIIDIRNVILEQGKQKTVLFSSHIMQEVEAICSRIILIDKGELRTDQTLQALETQQEDQQHTLLVRFEESLEPAWLTRLEAVISAEKNSSGVWKLTTSNIEIARKQLIQLALQENLNILSLESNKVSLEETFRQLTTKK